MKQRFATITAIIALLMGVATSPIWAEKKLEVKKVDFDRIKSVTQNPESRYFFPKLVSKYTSNVDTTMKMEDYRCLYYGYIFQEDYNPYRQSQYSDKVEALYYKKPHNRAECDSIEKYAELSLADNMFDFDQMEVYIYVLKEKKKHARSSVRREKIQKLIGAIMSSGKGTKEEPWVVICPMHEYNIVNFLGFVAVDHEAQDGGIDYVKVAPKEGSKTEGFYFDVRYMLNEAKRKGYDE